MKYNYYKIAIFVLFTSICIAAEPELLQAIDEGDCGFVKGYLVARGNVNAQDHKGRNLLHRAAARGHRQLVEDLLAKGAYTDHEDERGNTPLYAAVVGNHVDVVNLLIEAGAPINQADQRGVTVLQMAAYKGYLDTLSVLLRHQEIQVNLENHKKQSALRFACVGAGKADASTTPSQQTYEAIALKLLQAGADVNQADEEGTSILHWVVHDGNLSLVELLLRFNADVNVQRVDGTTPLMVASYFGYRAIAELLLSTSADPLKKACTELGGGMAYHYALQEGHEELANRLQQRMFEKQAIDKQIEMDQFVTVMDRYAKQIEFLTKKVNDLEGYDQLQADRVEFLHQNLTHMSVAPNQSQSVQQELKMIKEQVRLFEERDHIKSKELNLLKKQHHSLWNIHVQAREIEIIKNELRSRDETRIFYDTVFGKLQGIFSSYQMLDIGMVQRGKSNRWDKASAGINLLGSVVSLPFTGIVTSVLSGGAAVMAERSAERHVNFIIKRIRNPEILSQETESCARLLTSTYKPQILQLTVNGSKTLAQCAIGRLLEFMEAELLVDEISLEAQLLSAVSTFSSRQGFLGLRDQEIETQYKHKQVWMDKGIFQKSGIETPDGNLFYHPSKDESHVYGFRLSTHDEARKIGYVLKKR